MKTTSSFMRDRAEQFRVALEELGVHLAGDEVRVPDDAGQEGNRGRHPLDDEAVEGLTHAGERLLPIVAVHDDLREQGVVVGRDGIAGVDVGVDPHAGPAGRVVGRDQAGRRLEVAVRVLGVDAALDRMARGVVRHRPGS